MKRAKMLYDHQGVPVRDSAGQILFVDDTGQTLSITTDIVEALRPNGSVIVQTENEEPVELVFENGEQERSEILKKNSRFHDDDENNETDLENETIGWDDKATKLLLVLYEEFRPQVGKTIKFKTQTKMWNIIGKVMEEKGYKFTAVQINNRFKTLERSYKKMIDNNNKTGRGHKRIPYENELEGILGKRARIVPPAVIGRQGLKVQNKEKEEKDENSVGGGLNQQSKEKEEDLDGGDLRVQNNRREENDQNLDGGSIEILGTNTEGKENDKKIDPKEKLPKPIIKKKDGKTALLLEAISDNMKKNCDYLKNLVEEKSKTNEHLKEANGLRKERNELLRELILRQYQHE